MSEVPLYLPLVFAMRMKVVAGVRQDGVLNVKVEGTGQWVLSKQTKSEIRAPNPKTPNPRS